MVTPQAIALTAIPCREGVASFRTDSLWRDETALPRLHSWPRSMVYRILPFLHLPVNMSDERRRSPNVLICERIRRCGGTKRQARLATTCHTPVLGCPSTWRPRRRTSY